MSFAPVAAVLGVCYGPEICLSVVEAVAIDVVNEEQMGDVENLTVHPQAVLGGGLVAACAASCITSCRTDVGMPFVLRQALEIVRVDYCVFASC